MKGFILVGSEGTDGIYQRDLYLWGVKVLMGYTEENYICGECRNGWVIPKGFIPVRSGCSHGFNTLKEFILVRSGHSDAFNTMKEVWAQMSYTLITHLYMSGVLGGGLLSSYMNIKYEIYVGL